MTVSAPCPFCGLHLMHVGLNRHQHPLARCLLSARIIAGDDIRLWQARAPAVEDRWEAEARMDGFLSELMRGVRHG